MSYLLQLRLQLVQEPPSCGPVTDFQLTAFSNESGQRGEWTQEVSDTKLEFVFPLR